MLLYHTGHWQLIGSLVDVAIRLPMLLVGGLTSLANADGRSDGRTNRQTDELRLVCSIGWPGEPLAAVVPSSRVFDEGARATQCLVPICVVEVSVRPSVSQSIRKRLDGRSDCLAPR